MRRAVIVQRGIDDASNSNRNEANREIADKITENPRVSESPSEKSNGNPLSRSARCYPRCPLRPPPPPPADFDLIKPAVANLARCFAPHYRSPR